MYQAQALPLGASWEERHKPLLRGSGAEPCSGTPCPCPCSAAGLMGGKGGVVPMVTRDAKFSGSPLGAGFMRLRSIPAAGARAGRDPQAESPREVGIHQGCCQRSRVGVRGGGQERRGRERLEGPAWRSEALNAALRNVSRERTQQRWFPGAPRALSGSVGGAKRHLATLGSEKT